MAQTCLRWTGPTRVAGRRTLGVPADCGCSSTCFRSSGRCCSCGWRPALTGVRPARSGSFSPGGSASASRATVVVSVLYACTRRLLPLGALLNLSLVFPDEAPSRFRLALGTGTVETLEQRLRPHARGERGPERTEGRRDPPPACCRARRPRQDHARSRRARPCLLLQPRHPAPAVAGGTRPAQLGCAPARHREARGQHGDAQQPRQADGPAVGGAEAASAARRDARRADARLAGRVVGRGRPPPRALGRKGLPARNRGRGDPVAWPHRRDRGCL